MSEFRNGIHHIVIDLGSPSSPPPYNFFQGEKERRENKPINNIDMTQFDKEQQLALECGIRAGLDVRSYANPRFNSEQMGQIMTGLIQGVDISVYAKPEYSYEEMREIRHELVKAAWQEAVSEKQTSSTGLNKLADEIHQNAVDHGWWDEGRALPEVLMLCVSELSEALEEYRDSKPDFYLKDGKPEGVATELADCIIRILDFCASEEINIEEIINIKHEYNKSRPYRHGGKKC